MIKSKALEIIRTFSKEEIKQFLDFLNSPIFNKNKNLKEFSNLLISYHPSYEIENEFLFKKIYHGKIYNYDIIKKLMSELLNLCEKYLSWRSFENDSFQSRIYLLNELEKRNLDSYFIQVCKKTESALSENLLYADFIQKINYNSLKISFFQPRQVGFKSLELYSEKFLCGMIYFLDLLFAEIDGNANYRNNYNLNKTESFTDLLLDNINLDLFAKNLNVEDPYHKLILILINFIKFSVDPENESSFQIAKNHLLKLPIQNKESCLELIGLYEALHNYCLNKIGTGNRKYRYELFEIYKRKFELLKEFELTNLINWALFKNICSNAISINEINWVEKFIKDNLKYLKVELRSDIINYLYSLIEIERKNYEKALEYSAKININYHNLKAVVKQISLICFYELESYESALSCLDSYKHFLNNNPQIIEKYKEEHSKFINAYFKLIKFKIAGDYSNDFALKQVKNELEKITFANEWMLEKISELESLCKIKNQGKWRKNRI